jgi:hypothetical protein
MNTPKHEKSIKELFRQKCWSYLNVNFRKFTTENKIKIALALVCKDLEKDQNNGVDTKIIIIRDDKKPLVIEQKQEESSGRRISVNA